MFDTPDILNLHDIKRDSYICKRMSGRLESAEGRSLHAVAHLALARSQDSGTGILGEEQKKGQSGNRLSFFSYASLPAVRFPGMILKKILRSNDGIRDTGL